jgi:S1-C subfamily serine protease
MYGCESRRRCRDSGHASAYRSTLGDCSAVVQAPGQPRAGDIIVSANGTNVGDVSVLNRLISDVRIGSTITFGVVRGRPARQGCVSRSSARPGRADQELNIATRSGV